MSTFIETLINQPIAGTNFASYTTAKTVIPQTCLFQFRPNDLKIGTQLEIEVAGSLSNIVTTPGTVTFQVMLGSIAVWSSGAIQLNATAHTNLPFSLRVPLTVRAVGASTSANMIGIGVLVGKMFTLTAGQTDDANTPGAFMVPATAPAVGTGFDSTIANILDFWTGFSISDAGNNITVQQYSAKLIAA